MTTGMTSRRPPPEARRELVGTFVAGLICGLVVLAAASGLRDPAHVDRVTVVNPHPWYVNVAVTDPDHGGWYEIGALGRESRQSYLEVVDQGREWTFRFSYAGQQADLRVSRDRLERDEWRVTVPDQLALDLRTARVAESPP
jgi:hypothetical protein